MSISNASPRVLWLQVWGLAAVQGAIALTWVIYNLYLLKLLTDFGFPKTLATGLLIIENILAAVMEPLISFTLVVAAVALRLVNPNSSVQQEMPESSPSSQSFGSWRQISIPRLALVFGACVCVALGFRLMMQTFPQILDSQVPGANKGLILGGIFIALAVTAIPAGKLASRLGNRQAMAYGLVAMAGFMGLMVFTRNGAIASGIAIALGATFSLVSNGTIPFALSMVPPDKAGLGTGIYFSGGAVASSVFGASLVLYLVTQKGYHQLLVC